jgi:Winged helix DNA-binding domain
MDPPLSGHAAERVLGGLLVGLRGELGRDLLVAPDRLLVGDALWKQTGNSGVVLRNGEVAGLWRQQKKGRKLLLTIEPVTPLSVHDWRAIEAEAEPLVQFRGWTVTEVRYDESR